MVGEFARENLRVWLSSSGGGSIGSVIVNVIYLDFSIRENMLIKSRSMDRQSLLADSKRFDETRGSIGVSGQNCYK